MADISSSIIELDGRIAVIEDNLRDLVEQAAAISGGNDDDRSSERIDEQQRQLDDLKVRRDALR